MKPVTRACLVGAIFGSAAMASLIAVAAEIGASATYNLVTKPRMVTLDSTPLPIYVGPRFIPAIGTAEYPVGVARGDFLGAVFIENGVDNAKYRVTLGEASCSPDNSSVVSSAVTFAPTFSYPDTQGTSSVRPNGSIITFRDRTITLGGTLRVASTASPGDGDCTFQVSLVDAQS